MENKVLSGRQIAEILEALATEGIYWAKDDYDKKRYQRIRDLAYQLGAEPVENTAPVPRVPITPKIGVDGAVFNSQGQLLLIQRRDSKLWAMPGGAVEIGEAPSAAVSREVLEETGIQMRPERVVGVFDNWMDRRELAHHLYHIVIAGTAIGGEIMIQESEVLSAVWVERDAPLNPDEFHPGHFARLQHVWRGDTGYLD